MTHHKQRATTCQSYFFFFLIICLSLSLSLSLSHTSVLALSSLSSSHTSSEVHQKPVTMAPMATTSSKAHQETQIQQTHIKTQTQIQQTHIKNRIE